MDVFGFNLNHEQLTAGAIWIQNLKDDFDKNLNSIIVGWVVWPSRFKDSHTDLFTVWTKDSHRSTRCVNLDCPGFQLVKGSPLSPGDIITPVSDVNGKRHSITIKVYKDGSRGDWWLSCGIDKNPIPVGYFPASLFDSLSMKATQIGIGGHAESTKTTNLLQWEAEPLPLTLIKLHLSVIFGSSTRTV
uniref:Neprosin PEP catalytic domain-containing protein n=1 Tax=Hordeum vulgare subsp. vulgare TaxID=112509 RepID=A0A8I7BCW3_HORVV